MSRTSKLLWMTLLLPVQLAAAPAKETGAETSPKHAVTAYFEENDEARLLVDVFTAYYSDGEAFIPLQVSVAVMRSRTGLAITPARFFLIDPQGESHEATSPEQIREQYRHLSRDVQLMRKQRLNPGRGFDAYEHLKAEFYTDDPGPGGGTSRVHIPASMWWKGAIYFPMPPSGLEGLFTLKLDAEGATQPIAVKFEIPHKKKKPKKKARD